MGERNGPFSSHGGCMSDVGGTTVAVEREHVWIVANVEREVWDESAGVDSG